MNDPRALFTRLIDEAFNTGNLDVLSELVSPDLVEHQFESPTRPAPVVGPAGVARIITELRRGSHDFHLAVEEASVTGHTVFARLSATGTDSGGQLGNLPTGRTFKITVIDVARYDQDGQMVEHWGVPDRLGLLQQLGLLAVLAKPAEATAAQRSGHAQVDRPYMFAGGGRHAHNQIR